jgi:NAD(P)-dependent dehydrogenase (short-subunit alcohol dehydrogenase family)
MHNTEGVHANSRREQSDLLPLPPGALETPEDIGGVICFLASDAARSIAGQGVNATGGIHMT